MIHTLEIDSILFELGTKKILSDIFIKCQTGKLVGILGRNGQGKTCLMNIIYGTLNAASKSIRFDKISILHAFKHPELLVFLPQFSFIPKSFSIKSIFSDFNLKFDEFEQIFPEFSNKRNSILKLLSGGERRLIETYVIIKAKSKFALLDEPFTHLTPLQIEKVKLLLSTEKNYKGFLITDHLHEQVINICDNLYVLKDGKTHLVKTPSDIQSLGYINL